MSHFVSPTHHIQKNVWEPWAKATGEQSNGAFGKFIRAAADLRGTKLRHPGSVMTGVLKR